MSAPDHNHAIAILRVLRGRPLAPDDLALVDVVIGLLQPTKAALRQRRSTDIKRQQSVIKDAPNTPNPAPLERHAPPQTPPEEQNSPSFSELSEENSEEREGESDAGVRASGVADDTKTSVSKGALKTLVADALAGVVPAAEGPLDGYSRVAPDTRWLQAKQVFEQVVHSGMPSVPHELARKHFGELWPALEARAPRDPLGLLARVLTAYAADKRSKGKVPEVRYFCADFAQWADKPAGPVATPDRAEQLRRLQIELSEARIAADLAADMGDQATQERHAGRAKQLADKIEQLATRAA